MENGQKGKEQNITLKSIIEYIDIYNKDTSENYKNKENQIFNTISDFYNQEKDKNNSYDCYSTGVTVGKVAECLNKFFEKMYKNRTSGFFSFFLWSEFRSTYRKIKNKSTENLSNILETFIKAKLFQKSSMNEKNAQYLSDIFKKIENDENKRIENNLNQFNEGMKNLRQQAKNIRTKIIEKIDEACKAFDTMNASDLFERFPKIVKDVTEFIGQNVVTACLDHENDRKEVEDKLKELKKLLYLERLDEVSYVLTEIKSLLSSY